ncbi:TetR family transcriptional regulator [Christensenellaceae bacterium OttesenSCG-928-M15]|nr:TetR family transcriptional regulator [Christensenellaceae bacterium OttesenSCG-928-M15]
MGEQTVKAKAKRRELLHKILDNLPDNDFESITIKMICEAADISVGTFYHYFGDKSGLIPEMFALMDDHVEYVIQPTLKNDNALDDYMLFCHGIAAYMSSMHVSKVKLLYEFVPDFSSEIEESRPFYQTARRIIASGQEQGQIRLDINPNRIAQMTVIILRGYCYDWIRHEGAYDLIAYIDCFSRLFIDSLRPFMPG